jgi:environmental stress-induced protein Ves
VPKILRAARYRVMPWKDGGGSTAEIFVRPPGAPIDRFDWRVSLATIERDGDFSLFPGVDRTLTLLGRAAVTLRVEGWPARRLSADSPQLSFPGESRVHATVEEGASRDFNVMTRRERYMHRIERLALDGSSPIANRAATTLVFAAEGSMTLSDGAGRTTELGESDIALLTPTDGAGWTVCSAGAVLLVVEIDEATRV